MIPLLRIGRRLLLSTCALIVPMLGAQAACASPPVYDYEIVAEYPHDPQSFTEGLFYLDGYLYESTGVVGQSRLLKTELATGKILQAQDVAPPYFGEGIVQWNDELITLTWQHGVGFVHDLKTFRPLRQFTYKGEGWGLTQDGRHILMSDGTPRVRFLNPRTLKQEWSVTVKFDGTPLRGLNELEWVHGVVLANVWQTQWLACIEPSTGNVIASINLTDLYKKLPPSSPYPMELNGIAYDTAGDQLFVTGKYWPRVFEIRLRKGENVVTIGQIAAATSPSKSAATPPVR